jgi:hypothetical protein
VKNLENTNLDPAKSQELCDEIANMLINTLDAQDIDDKIDAAVNTFLTQQKLNTDPNNLTQRLSWSIKVKLES